MKAELVVGNILDQPVEVLVNSWNRNIIPWWLLLPQGVSGAIKKSGGTEPFKQVAKFGPMAINLFGSVRWHWFYSFAVGSTVPEVGASRDHFIR